jgi:hypothetical protein
MADKPDKPDVPGRGPARTPARDFIAENLRALFESAERDPLPEALQTLLDRLAREEEARVARGEEDDAPARR